MFRLDVDFELSRCQIFAHYPKVGNNICIFQCLIRIIIEPIKISLIAFINFTSLPPRLKIIPMMN